MKDPWKRYHEKWINYPLEYHSTGDKKSFSHFKNTFLEICELLSLNNSDTLLDIGCASGVITRMFKEVCKKVYGVDYCYGLLKIAKEYNSSIKKVSYVVASATKLPFTNECMDKVNIYNVIHTLPDIKESYVLIKEALRVTKKDGKILLGDIPDISKKNKIPRKIRLRKLLFSIFPISLKKKIKEWFNIREIKGLPFIWYDIKELVYFLEEQNFEVEVIPKKKGLHEWYHRVHILIKKI